MLEIGLLVSVLVVGIFLVINQLSTHYWQKQQARIMQGYLREILQDSRLQNTSCKRIEAELRDLH